MTIVAKDLNGQTLQVAGWKDNPLTVSLTTTTARNVTAIGENTKVVRVVSTVDTFIRQGDSSIVATTSSNPIYANTPEYIKTDKNKYIAGILTSGTGTLYITECD